jgi:hypothetical protein
MEGGSSGRRGVQVGGGHALGGGRKLFQSTPSRYKNYENSRKSTSVDRGRAHEVNPASRGGHALGGGGQVPVKVKSEAARMAAVRKIEAERCRLEARIRSEGTRAKTPVRSSRNDGDRNAVDRAPQALDAAGTPTRGGVLNHTNCHTTCNSKILPSSLLSSSSFPLPSACPESGGHAYENTIFYTEIWHFPRQISR